MKPILDNAHNQAKKILEERRTQVELMAMMLIEFETLDAEDVQKIVKDEWDPEDKRQRLKRLTSCIKPITPPPPPNEPDTQIGSMGQS